MNENEFNNIKDEESISFADLLRLTDEQCEIRSAIHMERARQRHLTV